jgi:hypothetical protein
MGRIEPTDDYGTEDDERDDNLQGGRQELLLVSGRVVRSLQFGEGEGRNKYRPNTHLDDQSVNTQS